MDYIDNDDELDNWAGYAEADMEGEECDVCFEGFYRVVPGSDSVECDNCGHRMPRFGWG